jgi:hypothetical protein
LAIATRNLVAELVTELVVDRLEAVDVAHQDGRGHVGVMRLRRGCEGRFVEATPVEQSAPHSHHAVFDRHVVNFEARRALHRSTEKAVRPVPTVLDDEIASTDLRSHRGRSRPGIRDHDIARFELLRRGELCGSQQDAGERDVEEL